MNTLDLAHRFIRERVKPGDLCIDATAGRGYDTALLCELVGEEGHVIAFDIQQEAVDSTKNLLAERSLADRAEVLLESHANIDQHAAPGSVACITYNLGWLPGGDHSIMTKPDSSIESLEKALTLLAPGGVISLCIYYGGRSGYYDERDAVLAYLKTINAYKYTVLVTQFQNRSGDPPIPVFILNET